MQIRKPRSKTSKWTIQERVDGKYHKVLVPELVPINDQYLSGKISPDEAYAAILKVIKPPAQSGTNENYSIAERYWNARYSKKRLVDPKSARYDLQRAIVAIRGASLLTATEDDFLTQLSRYSGQKHRRIVRVLNSLLKWLKRDIILHPDKKQHLRVNFITEIQLNKLCNSIHKKELVLLTKMAFYTGCRIGELMALEENNLNLIGKTLHVFEQIDRHGKRKTTKTNKSRNAYIYQKGVDIYQEWVSVKHSVLESNRLKTQWLRSACRRSGIPVIKFHDLRHSYAISLFRKGVSVSWVALQLGASNQVTEEYYIGHIVADDVISAIDRLVKS